MTRSLPMFIRVRLDSCTATGPAERAAPNWPDGMETVLARCEQDQLLPDPSKSRQACPVRLKVRHAGLLTCVPQIGWNSERAVCPVDHEVSRLAGPGGKPWREGRAARHRPGVVGASTAAFEVAAASRASDQAAQHLGYLRPDGTASVQSGSDKAAGQRSHGTRAAMTAGMFTSPSGTAPPRCRQPSSGGTCCRQVTAGPTDKRRTDDQGLDRHADDQALDLVLHS
jgi:hypothetical protein